MENNEKKPNAAARHASKSGRVLRMVCTEGGCRHAGDNVNSTSMLCESRAIKVQKWLR